MEEVDSVEEIDLRELFDYFKSKISWIIIIVALAIGMGNLYTLVTRVPMYKSSTSLVLVVENNENTAYTNSEQQLNKNLVGTYSEIIKSKKILNEVIKNLELNYTTSYLQKAITVSSVANTEIISITVSDQNNKLAAQIADETAYVFTKEIVNIYKLNNVSILDRAEVEKSPYNVNYIKDNIIYVLIGIVISCGLIFVFFYFDTTIKTAEEVEKKLGLTIIGIVPKVGKD